MASTLAFKRRIFPYHILSFPTTLIWWESSCVLTTAKSGKFMHLSQRSASINTYCLSKVFFKCSSIDLRTVDTTNITASIKSWLFQDQLVKPEDFLLYRARSEGGLGLIHPKVKAQALFIKCFLETATTGNFLQNKYHEAIFKWYVLHERDFIHPSLPPYMSEESCTTLVRPLMKDSSSRQ